MDIESFSERENMLRLREELLRVEEDRMNGIEDLTLEETAKILKSAMEKTEKTINHV